MANGLTFGQKWAIYLLMAPHETTTNNDGKSSFRVAVEAAAGSATDWTPALTQVAGQLIDPTITSLPGTALGVTLPPNFTAQNLRVTLGFTTLEDDPDMGPCPNGVTLASGSADAQKAIVQALLPMTGPA